MNIRIIYLLIFSTAEFLGMNSSSGSEMETSNRMTICESAECDQNQHSLTNQPPTPWIAEIFAEAERQFSIHPEASDQCKDSFNLYKMHLENHSLWAVLMNESSQWPKQGIFSGMTPFFGHFDGCIAVNAHDIQGKHCLVESTLHFHEHAPVIPSHPLASPSQNSSVWLAFRTYRNDVHRVERDKFWWTLCVPSSCSSVDLDKSLKRAMRNVFGKYAITSTVNVMEDRCHTNQTELDEQYYYVKYFIGLLGLAVIFSSVFHARADSVDQSTCSNLTKCLSIQKSYYKLIDVAPGREYMLMHVYKVLCIVALMSLHRLAYMIRHVRHDTNAVEQLIYTLNKAFFYGPEFTDLMFFFSGVLMYKDFAKSEKNEVHEIPTKIAKRWLRLFSTYMVSRLFFAHILPTLNNGALWHEMREEANYCKTNLLDALLTLPRARNDQMCLPPSWQMAVDFQLFIAANLSLSLCRYYKLNEFKALLCLMGIACISTFCNIFYNEFTAIVFLNLRHFNVDRNEWNSEIFHSSYMSVTARLAPYFIGILVAATAHRMKKEGYVLSKAQQIYGSVAAICIQSLMVISGLGLYNLRITNEYRRGWHSIHGAFLHAFNNLPIIFLFFVYFVNGFEYLEKRIPRIVVPLSRLSHVVSLSHFMVILPHVFSLRAHVPYTSLYSRIHVIVADAILSYILAFLMYLLIDGPVQNLLLIWRKSAKKNHDQESEDGISKKNQ